jgi:hypothetical protein
MRYRPVALLGAAIALALALTGCVPPTGPGGPTLPGNCVKTGPTVRCTFAYNGKDGSDGEPQRFVVPANVHTVTIDAYGAQGGGTGGLGGHARGTFSVVSSTVMHIRVGGTPTDGVSGGFNGGGAGSPGGGGGSDVRIGGDLVSNRVVVAGGGGGEGILQFANGASIITFPLNGGSGGGANGGDGGCSLPPPATIVLNQCGAGGTPTTGGSFGSSGCQGVLHLVGLSDATNGASGNGGVGAFIQCQVSTIQADVHGAGGGGGWFGGGGAGASPSEIPAGEVIGGAGGGSEFVSPSASSPVNEAGMQSANGTVFVSYTP